MSKKHRKPKKQPREVELPFGVGRAEELPVLVVGLRPKGYTATLSFGPEFNAVRDYKSVFAMKAALLSFPGATLALRDSNIDIPDEVLLPIAADHDPRVAFSRIRDSLLESEYGLSLDDVSISAPHDRAAANALVDAGRHVSTHWSVRKADLPPPPRVENHDPAFELRMLARWFTEASASTTSLSDYDKQLLWSDLVLLQRLATELDVSPYGAELPDDVLSPAGLATERDPPSTEASGCSHSQDFTSVTWFGVKHTFKTGQQTAVVKALWEAWESGNPTLGIHTLAEAADSDAETFRLDHVFRGHVALRSMIKSVRRGTYALVEPRPPEAIT